MPSVLERTQKGVEKFSSPQEEIAYLREQVKRQQENIGRNRGGSNCRWRALLWMDTAPGKFGTPCERLETHNARAGRSSVARAG